MITYEWVLETLDDDDIIEVRHEDSYAAVLAQKPADGTPYQIALVRDDHNKVDHGLQDRAWAYVTDGKLPESFDNGRAVPKRFHEEVAR